MVTLPQKDGLTIAVQATNRCQLRCAYCMATKNGDDISKEIILKAMHTLSSLVPSDRPITFVWHGGEPLQVGIEFYKWVKEVQKIAFKGSGIVKNVFQTNGLLLDKKFIDFILDVDDFAPNISMDGPDVVTLKTRGVKSLKYDKIFCRLQDRGVKFGVAVVASNDVLQNKDEVINYFLERNITNVGLVPYHTFSHDDHNLSPTAIYSIKDLSIVEDLANHSTLTETPPPSTILADLSLKQYTGDDPIEGITVLGKSLMKGMVSQALHSDCTLSSFTGGCHKRVLCIAVNGFIYPCPRGQNVNLWNYGNVMESGLENWWQTTFGPSPFRPSLPQECELCKYKSICHGGCPANAKSMNGGAHKRDYYCPSFVKMFEAAELIIESRLVNYNRLN